jgi:hypothetical protein
VFAPVTATIAGLPGSPARKTAEVFEAIEVTMYVNDSLTMKTYSPTLSSSSNTVLEPVTTPPPPPATTAVMATVPVLALFLSLFPHPDISCFLLLTFIYDADTAAPLGAVAFVWASRAFVSTSRIFAAINSVA